MPDFSTEFWVATGIAAVALLVGLAVTLAMDAKTRGEFRFAAGCFLLTAAITVYGIGVFEMSVMWPAKLRVPVACGLFAVVAVLACESIRWAHARHLSAVAAHGPSSGKTGADNKTGASDSSNPQDVAQEASAAVPKKPPASPETKAQPPSPKAPPTRPVPLVKKPESPPTFTEKVEYRISIGSDSIQIAPGQRATLLSMDKNVYRFGSAKVDENSLVVGSVENGKVLVDAKLYSGPGANPLEITRNQFSLSNATWDRNFNDTAFEVVNQDNVPALQIIYQTPYNVVIYGTFQQHAGGGVLYVTHKGNHFNPTSPPPPLKRIFKYPSRKYLGQEEN